MPKTKRNASELDDPELDDFIEDDEEAPKSKKTKKEMKPGPKSKATTSSNSAGFWSLSTGRTPRRVEISEFKGTTLINIREFYEKNDEYLPGKKGISLSIDQYKAFINAIPKINTSLKNSGIDVSAEDEGSADEEEGSREDGGEKSKKVKAKPKKSKSRSNIEATSDEEEDDD